MRLYSKQNENLWFDTFNIYLLFPSIKRFKEKNEWIHDYSVFGCQVEFNTRFLFKKERGFWCVIVTLLGFGVSITKQTDY